MMYCSLIICLLYCILLTAALKNNLSIKVRRNGKELLIQSPLVTYTDSLEALKLELMRYQHKSVTILPSNYGFYGSPESKLSRALATRTCLFDNSLIIDPFKLEKRVGLETKQFVTLFPADVIDAASNIIEEMKQLAQMMLSFNLPITCRLTLMQGVRCPQWHEDYVKIRLIKSYLGPGTDWVDPGDRVVRSTNWINAQLDRPLVVPIEKIQHAKEGDILVLVGRRYENGIPVLHRSPISSTEERRLLYTVTIA